VITPMFGDQFYWADRVIDLGIGTAIPHATMSEGSLMASVRQVLAPAVGERARTFARELGWDGAKIAARRIHADYGASAP
jgi:vancomycin aglycone glucosyltransferase